MKTLRLLAFVLALLMLNTASHAAILVYKGTGRIMRANGVSGKVVPTTLFFVVDTATLEGLWVFAQSIGGVKTVFADNPSRAYGLAQIPTVPTASVYYSNTSGAYVAANNFNFFSVRMGGKLGKVFLTKGAPQSFLFGKTMAGSYSYTDGTPRVVDGPFTVTVNTVETQFANGQGLNVAQTAGKIVGDYKGKGYTETVPTP